MTYRFYAPKYDLERTLISGQVFRWKKVGDHFEGVVGNNVIFLKKRDDFILADVIAGSMSESVLKNYLGLNVDYEEILESISEDEFVNKAIEEYEGYYVLNQDPYETLITFICSTNSNIPNTRAKSENLANLFGKQITDKYFSLPEPEILAGLSEGEIMKAKVGYRGKYLIETADMLLNSNLLSKIEEKKDTEAVNSLVQLPGVGKKVADCVLLFGFGRLNRVPIDVWIKRILVNLYGIDDNMKYDEMEDFAEKRLGKYAGYASHFLFEAARAGKLSL